MIRTILVMLAAVLSCNSYADGRWFEIEVIVFNQPADGSTETLRNEEADLSKYAFTKDLLTPAYLSTYTERCLSGEITASQRESSGIFTDNTIPHSNTCDFSVSDLAKESRLPIEVNVPEQEHTDTPYLLSPSQLQFTDKRADLARNGRTVILHTGWRFPGESKRNAPSYRLFGGNSVALSAQMDDTLQSNLTEQTSKDIVAHEFNTQNTFFENNQTTYNPVWELDGFLKVHLNHYLYITSNLITRHSGDTDTGVSSEFSQFRRVISGEIHYFDHPQIGMLVQIRRFNH
ncbi:CsiV family protein [Pseudoalteromonas pernae]|uniref:CsiV family protein n=1 Tax=Pseudoalteromonas pernae TaxID=3118054 RepID=UPI003242688E